MKRVLIILSITLLTIQPIFGQVGQFKQIKTSGDYQHDSSRTIFPINIGDYDRIEITAFDEQQKNIGVGYYSMTSRGVTAVDIFIYPAETAYEDRLKDEYTKSLQAITIVESKIIVGTQNPQYLSKGNYRVLGLSAELYDSATYKNTKLSVFECGKWFVKFRLSSNYLGISSLDSVQTIFSSVVSPVDLLKRFPLKPEYKITVAPIAMRDTVLLHAVLASAFKKKEWFQKYVDTLESKAGVPGLYLEAHTASLMEFVNDGLGTRLNSVMSTNNYYKTLKRIIDYGYLDEFVMANYHMLLVVPPSIKLEMEEYKKWAKIDIPGFNLNAKYFLIQYSDQ